jgi:hypothetical protein
MTPTLVLHFVLTTEYTGNPAHYADGTRRPNRVDARPCAVVIPRYRTHVEVVGEVCAILTHVR